MERFLTGGPQVVPKGSARLDGAFISYAVLL